MFTEPTVSRRKFEQEVGQVQAQRDAYIRRGVWVLDASFPDVFVVLMAVKAPPYAAIIGVVINFDNYDIEPPSIRFVNPVTRQPLKAMELPHRMSRLKVIRDGAGQPVTGPQGEALVEEQHLIQFEDPQGPPFLCLQGVREYHAHPAHTGDSWWLHRSTGAGRLARLLDVLATHGSDPVQGIRMQIQFQFNGFTFSPRPE